MIPLNENIVFRAFQQPIDFGISLHIGSRSNDGSGLEFVAKNMEFTKVEPGDFIDPVLKITSEAAQGLMDELYRLGIRPTDAPDASGELKATKFHLNDMRELFKEFREAARRRPMEGAND